MRSKLASDASDNIVSVGNRRVRIYEKLKNNKMNKQENCSYHNNILIYIINNG